MLYTALKPCSFAGQKFKIGDTIPDGLILPEAIKRLSNSNIIAESGIGPLLPIPSSLGNKEELISIPLAMSEGEVHLTIEQIKNILEIVQQPEEEIISRLEGLNEEELILLTAIAQNDVIYEAAKAQVTAETEEPEKQPKGKRKGKATEGGK